MKDRTALGTDIELGTSNSERVTPASGRVIAGIPCFNTALHIRDVVARTLPFVDEVVVVDDGSVDGTGDIAAGAGATVVTHPKNMGYGAAIRSCFEYASTHGAGILVTLDGDGQHFPEDIPGLIAPIVEGRAAVVTGSRFLEADDGLHRSNVPRYRAFGIRVITLLFNLASGCRVTDAQCGLRAYDAQALSDLMPTGSGMDVSVELLVAARAKSFRIGEAAVGCLYHSGGSTQHPVPQGVGTALAVLWLRTVAILGRWVRVLRNRHASAPRAPASRNDEVS